MARPGTVRIHPTAIVAAEAELGSEVSVGPYAVLEADVVVGEGSTIGAHAVLHGGCRLGRRVMVSPHAVLGGAPQDLGFRGARSAVSIGDGTVVREYVTVHRASVEGGETRVGRGCLLMTLVHVGHDCQVGDGVILTSYAGLSGHVTLEDRVVVGGITGFHQFVRVGRMAMVSGASRVVKDVPPFVVAEGNPCRVRGLNVVGLRRAGIPPETRDTIKQAFRLLYRSGLNTTQALDAIREGVAPCPEVEQLIAFVEASKRGITPGMRRRRDDE